MGQTDRRITLFQNASLDYFHYAQTEMSVFRVRHTGWQATAEYTRTHPFNGPFSGTTQVSQYQKGKINLDLLKQETVSGSGISWTICKSALCSRQITTLPPHHSVFNRPDALPAAQPTASKH